MWNISNCALLSNPVVFDLVGTTQIKLPQDPPSSVTLIFAFTPAKNRGRQYGHLPRQHSTVRQHAQRQCYIKRLPFELLAQIFKLNLSVSNDQEFPRTPLEAWEIERSLWSVSHTCRSWRNTIISIPALWNAIDVFGGKSRDRSQAVRIQSHLKYSQTLPLDVAMHAITPEDLARFGALLAQTGRWRSLFLVAKRPENTTKILTMLTNFSAPFLRTLIIDCCQLDNPTKLGLGDYQERCAVARGVCPLTKNGTKPLQLQTLSVSGAQLDWRRPAFRGITHLKLTRAFDLYFNPKLNDMLDFIAASPDLKTLELECTLTCLEISFEDPRRAPPIELKKLEHLTLSAYSEDDVTEVMSNLHMPNLCMLTVTLADGDFLPLLQEMKKPYRSTGRSLLASLKGLNIVDWDCEDGNASGRALYEELQKVRVLAVGHQFGTPGKGWMEDVIALTDTYRHSAPGTFPQILPRWTMAVIWDANISKLAPLVAARIAAGFPLRKLFVQTKHELPASHVDWLVRHVDVFGTIDTVGGYSRDLPDLMKIDDAPAGSFALETLCEDAGFEILEVDQD
ncbi:hypothetical protein EVG20_g2129 [Dentipellis fragilis]|uniref:Uncharacterized protein n=1 Tax=Dentipellis fragilis TaxID=205917 RepID=A0A4Y9Z7L9_9AGAM|nr:hypothetical protein EVG20_g2129 [Dentipellis fragilis]